jgi:hypothetical protein
MPWLVTRNLVSTGLRETQVTFGGLGMRRGPFDRCDPFYYAGYGSSYRNAYYIGPVSGGVCGGRGAHIACNAYGICWVACN